MKYRLAALRSDLIAGVTLAAYALPVSLAYATVAGLPPQVGVYGYLLGGLGYALAGSSRYLAIGPTSAISLMIAGTVSGLANNDPVRYAEIATATAVAVGLLCLLAWTLRLSVLVKLISDSVLTGFKAGAGLTIMLTQVPVLLGVPGGGHNVPERLLMLAGQLDMTNPVTIAIGAAALLLLWAGGRLLPGRPVPIVVVALSIVAMGFIDPMRFGVAVAGVIPAGLPQPVMPAMPLRAQQEVLALAGGCMLLAYIEGVAAARAFAAKHGQAISPRREFLGLAAANLAVAAVGGYPVAGGLSQTAVNEQAGAHGRGSLVVASAALGICLLFFTGPLAGMPRAVLAAVVLLAVAGLIDIPALRHMASSSRQDFVSAMAALVGVLLLGILQGIVLAALVSVLLFLVQSTRPHVAVLGRIPGTDKFSDVRRHPDGEPIPGALAFRPEASLIYLNAEHVMASVLAELSRTRSGSVRAVFVDLSASPVIDLAGAHMLGELQRNLARRGISLTVAGAHGSVRDLLRAEGLDRRIAGVERGVTIQNELAAFLHSGQLLAA